MKKKILIIALTFFLAAAAVFLVMSVIRERNVNAQKMKIVKTVNIESDSFGVFTSKEEASLEKPNIVLIVIESSRVDHFSSYGYSRATTPRIDNFAKNAFRFTDCVSTSSWTIPSHMSMLTGLYPGAHNVIQEQRRISEKITTLAQVLKRENYYTVGFVSNPLLSTRTTGFGKGFDFYDDFTVDLDAEHNLFENQTEEERVCISSRTSPALNKTILGWLKTNHNKKFFLFAHYFDPHFDYVPRPPYDTLFDQGYKGKADGRNIKELKPGIPKRDLEHIVSLYDGEIRYTDEYVGALLRELDNLGLKEKTLIIITSDHGQEFFEHGATAHGHTLYNELIRVPLIIKLPGVSRKPAVINALTSNVDFMPTICDYLKINAPEGIQGKSLLPVMNGKKPEEERSVFSETFFVTSNLKAIINNGFKFIYDYNKGKKELYNLEKDLGEMNNLIKTEPQKATLLEKELMDFVNSSANLASTLSSDSDTTVVIDEETKKKLKTLGYLQ